MSYVDCGFRVLCICSAAVEQRRSLQQPLQIPASKNNLVLARRAGCQAVKCLEFDAEQLGHYRLSVERVPGEILFGFLAF